MKRAALALLALLAAACAGESPDTASGTCPALPAAVTVTQALSPGGFAVDAENLYWSGKRPVGTTHFTFMPKAGGEQRVVVDDWAYPISLAFADATGAYFADAEEVFRFDPAQPELTLGGAVPCGGAPRAIAARDHTAFCLGDGAAWMLFGGRRATNAEPLVLDQGLPGSRGGDLLVVDDVAYLSSADPDAVLALPIADRPPEPLGAAGPAALLTKADPASPLSIDGDTLYFVGTDPSGEHGVLRMPRAGGAAELVAKATDVAGLAVSRGAVYVADRGAQGKGTLSLASEGVVCPIATGLSFPAQDAGAARWIAADEGRVYWMTVENGVGTIHAAAR